MFKYDFMRFKVSAQNLGGKFTTEKVVFMLYVAEILPHNENSTISQLGVQLVGLEENQKYSGVTQF